MVSSAGRRLAAAIVVVLLLLVACSSNRPSRPAASPTPSLTAVVSRCTEQGGSSAGPPFTFRTDDGATLDAAEFGSGSSGIVLVHESGADLCGWVTWAAHLADSGYRVLVFDLRCVGQSSCPATDGQGNRADVRAAVTAIRSRGASGVQLVGASLGASAAIVAGSDGLAGVRSVVSLSADELDSDIGGRTALQGAALLPVPLLAAVSTADSFVSVAETRALLARAPHRQPLLLAGASAGHGWELLSNDTGWTTTEARVQTFLAAHRT